LASPALLPPVKSEPQRFAWHPLLQVTPIPSLQIGRAGSTDGRRTLWLDGWLPLVRDRDVWPMLQRFNDVPARTAADLGDARGARACR
jgi:hypothetical protein